ncbi:heme oxygenase (biliverdin-producing) [Gordonia phosphorivorans]|uniref:Heme oxygenase (Biliverdin-producing) n=1 Tax=Gordonia phosphorivorans TaxID=1056982 RepID=A0ABV6HB52_9ACTN
MTTTSLAPSELVKLPLSAAMKQGSALEHDQAEQSAFIDALLGGRVNEAGYAVYLRTLRPVYAALESVGRDLAAAPLVAPIFDAGLERLAAIDSDIDHWAPGESHSIESAAASAYVEAITESTSWAGLYVAHHYTRYLGDLSGGQAIGTLLNRAFELEGKGLSFYDFAEIGKNKPYKDTYRAQLDAIGAGLTDDERLRVVDEVCTAFRLNQALFAEIGANLDQYRR